MPRGFRKDIAATQDRKLLDSRSFVSRQLILGNYECQNAKHEILYGKDKSARRREVYERAKGRCEQCGRAASWETGEWDHIKGGLTGRCDCLSNAQWVCGANSNGCNFHRRKHNQ